MGAISHGLERRWCTWTQLLAGVCGDTWSSSPELPAFPCPPKALYPRAREHERAPPAPAERREQKRRALRAATSSCPQPRRCAALPFPCRAGPRAAAVAGQWARGRARGAAPLFALQRERRSSNDRWPALCRRRAASARRFLRRAGRWAAVVRSPSFSLIFWTLLARNTRQSGAGDKCFRAGGVCWAPGSFCGAQRCRLALPPLGRAAALYGPPMKTPTACSL